MRGLFRRAPVAAGAAVVVLVPAAGVAAASGGLDIALAIKALVGVTVLPMRRKAGDRR